MLLIGSWDDFYSLEYNDYWRSEMNSDFVERNYTEVLDAASLGDEFFNNYLHSKDITHILVPLTTFNNGLIRHKFGIRGSIEIKVGDPYLSVAGSSTGPYSSVLLSVQKPTGLSKVVDQPSYEITWKNVDWWFYTKQTKSVEVGLYNYSFDPFYEWGPDVSWFFDLSPERSSDLEIVFSSRSKTLNNVKLELTLVAAYGSNAPSHTVLVSTKNDSEIRILKPGNPGVFQFEIKSGESVTVKNITPCRLPNTFEPKDQSIFKICFGVSRVDIQPQLQVE